MRIDYIPPGPYDALMESDLRKIERSLPSTPRDALAVEYARFVGEAVAAVVAQTPDQARAARDAPSPWFYWMVYKRINHEQS